MNPRNADLVRMAQAGDVESLGILLEGHRAALYAKALGILGHGQDAQDAVQDTFLVALVKISDLKDPEADGAWLRAIVRRVCLNRLRAKRGDISTTWLNGDEPLPGDRESSVEEYMDRLALREWVWAAFAELPEVLRVTAMLRYFGSYSSYEEIAAILGVPIGTVRSRLSQAREKLTDALMKTASLAHDEARAINLHYRQQFSDLCAHYNRGEISRDFVATYSSGVAGDFAGVAFRGSDYFFDGLREDTMVGVKLHPTNVLASRGVVVYEAEWENPPDDPFHCPPAMTHVEFLRDGMVHAVRLFHAPRPPLPPADHNWASRRHE